MSERSNAQMCKQKYRLENKKRKVKAFLELVSKDPEYLNYREKRFKNGTYSSEDDSSSSLTSLRTQVREYKKFKGPPPSLELLEPGIQAQVFIPGNSINKPTSVPLYIGDIQQLLLKAVLNIASPCRPRWCSLHQSHAVSKVILLIVDGLSKDAIMAKLPLFHSVDIFQNMVEIITPYRYSSTFASELCELSLLLCYEVIPNSGIQNWDIVPCNSHKPLASIVPVLPDQTSNNARDPEEGFSRLHLLLSPIQMVMENFPLPQGVFECSNTKGYKMTKDIYSPVTSKSPLFAIDCEMCRVATGRMEVTRVAIVNEELETVYCTLVKPNEKIIDYVTKYSGITEKMLRPVTTRLEDVQKNIKELLPSDAILCGQSLNFDLHALRIIHPYIIDTSVIYNTSGCRTRKTSLKGLSSTFLKENIQNSEEGHHPVEDCVAAMKLIQLKLQNGPHFGDTILSPKTPVNVDQPLPDKQKGLNDVCVQDSKDNIVTSFFAPFPAEKKTSLIVVRDDFDCQYTKEMLNVSVTKETVSSNKKVLKHTLREMVNYNLIISHVRFPSCNDNSEALTKIDNWVAKLYNASDPNSVFMLIGTGLRKPDGRCENGFCQVKIKEP